MLVKKSQTFVGTSHPFEVISKCRLSSNQVREYSHLCRGHIDVDSFKDGRIEKTCKVMCLLRTLSSCPDSIRLWRKKYSCMFLHPHAKALSIKLLFQLFFFIIYLFQSIFVSFLTVSYGFFLVSLQFIFFLLLGVWHEGMFHCPFKERCVTLCQTCTAHWLQMLC